MIAGNKNSHDRRQNAGKFAENTSTLRSDTRLDYRRRLNPCLTVLRNARHWLCWVGLSRMKQSSSSGNFVATRRFDCFVQNATTRVVGVGSINVLSRHCHQLAGLNSDWAISHVQLDVQRQTLTLSLEFVGTRVVCPECGLSVP
jgi:hypothetical protein